MTDNTVVVLESPFSGDIDRHVAYGQRCMADARERKEIVIMPHLLWTQHHKAKHHFVSDFAPEFEIKNGGREASLEQIKELRRRADKTVFYIDYGYSSGMRHALDHCKEEGLPYEERILGNLQQDVYNAKFRTCETDKNGQTLAEFLRDRR